MESILFLLFIVSALFVLVVWVVIAHHFKSLGIPRDQDISRKIMKVFLIGSLTLLGLSGLLLITLLL